EMLKSVAVSSANDCACALAEHIAGSEAAFVEKMNERAAELGMENTHFVNCTGLDDDPAAKDHLTTAYDIALMSRQLMKNHPQIKDYTTIWMDTVRNGSFGLSNTNKLVRFYPGATGLKTGFTSGAGYCLSATAEKDGLGLVAVVMGAETSKDRFNTCRSLLDFGFAGYALVTPELPNATVPVTLGKQDWVNAIPATDPILLVEKAKKSSITTQIELLPTVSAPVSKGQRLGTLTIRSGEHTLAEIPLIAADVVQKLSYWDVFKQLLRQFFAGKS
ncbi:MAG: D-alanyl-D-alanine carboxypeptidase, partial [Oscillospiraceae bacterium]|nr:D-alanyl-D-alanine carboxypeptidase [Oscillospiraceae bacterium]